MCTQAGGARCSLVGWGPLVADLPRALHVALGGHVRAQQFVADLGEALCRRAGPGRAAVLTDSNRALLRRAARNEALCAQMRRTGRPRGDVRSALQSLGPLNGFIPEIVHAYGQASAIVADHLARRWHVPWVVTGFGPVSAGWREARLLRRAARIVALSERLAPRVPRLNTEVIPGGIDRREFNPAAIAENLMVELGLDPHTLHLGMVGRFDSPASGAFDFLEAAARVARKIPHVEFVVVGDGALLDDMVGYAHRAGVFANVRFLGPRADRGRLYNVLDCVVLPAHEAAFAWELLEAGASGTRILLSHIDAHREILAAQDPLVTYFPAGDVDALAAHLYRIVSTPGIGGGPQIVDLAALGTGLSGAVRAEIAETHYAIGDEELEQVVDPDGPLSLRRIVYGIYEISRIARRYAALYEETVRGVTCAR